MKDSEADIAIGVLNKLIDQELEAVRAATRDGNTPSAATPQTRHNAFLYAKDEITEVCADCMWRLKFQPVKTISLDIYRLFEKWLDEQKETER